MFNDYTNYIRIAVDRVGGATKTSIMLEVSTQTVHKWIKARRISNIDYARALAHASNLDLMQLRPTR